MSDYNEEPLYDLQEDENEKWGLNYAQSDNYILEEGDKVRKEENIKSKNPFIILMKILLSPVEGWKTLRREKLTEEQVQSGCFYPLIALLSISNFAGLFYFPTLTLTQAIVNAMVAFVSFFFGYFCILIFLKILLPNNNRDRFTTNFGKSFILMSLSSLALFKIFVNLFPMIWAILIFLPLWTIYSMFKGMRFFKLPERGTLRFTFFVCGTVMVIPYGIEYLLNIFLPY